MARQASPFAFRDFRFYWAARITATLGQMMMVVIIGWQVYDVARRSGMDQPQAAFQLGLIGVVQFVPLVVLTLVVGWVADRLDRRWIVRAALLLECGCAAVLATMTLNDTIGLTALFVIAGLLGVARAFAQPALQALSPNLVPAEVLPSAIAVSSLAWQTGGILGPALGGFLYAAHAWVPYGASTALFLISFSAMMMIGPVPRSTIASGGTPWSQMVDGLRYVLRNRLVLGAISLDLFAVLLGGATAMLPVFARDILHAGPQGMGLLRMAPAVGAVAIGLYFAVRPLRSAVGVKMLIAVAVFGGATVVFGLSRSMPLSLVCLALLGAADMLSVFVRQSLIQLYTPDAMRGRVGAVSTLFVSGSNELGEAESGFLAAAIGPVAAVVAGGIGAVLVTLLWSRLFPELPAARTFEPPATLEDAPLQERPT